MSEYIAIYKKRLIARGNLSTIVRKTKAVRPDIEPYVFELDTCKRIDFSWQGDVETVIKGLPESDTTDTPSNQQKRGRPKLGVTAKEVTLLPRHWDWLAQQRGGASVTLRSLVDSAMKNITVEQRINQKQNQLYQLLSVFADEPGFEEATRALYRNSQALFEKSVATWPSDIQSLILEKFTAIAQLHQQEQVDD